VSVAFLFPGQGAEAPLMGGPALLRSERVRGWLAAASTIVGVDVAEAIERGIPELRRTEVAQPALTAVCLGLYAALAERGVRPDVVAGHSLGEVAAFAAAGACSLEAAVTLAAKRGRLMAEAAATTPGGMLALKVATEHDVRAALAVGGGVGRIELAAENGPDEWVLTGDKPALMAVAACFPAVLLPVAGPWHSRAMAGAEARFRRTLARLRLRPPRCALVVNRDGGLVSADADLVDLLAGQLTRPIGWVRAMATLTALGTRTWVIVGPGRTLRGLVRKNAGPAARVVIVQDEGDLEALAA